MQKTHQNSNIAANSKKNLLGFLMTTIIIILLNTLSTSAQNCPLTISAKNNIESVNDEGRVYFISLKNNSRESIIVTLAIENHNTGTNPDESSANGNVVLDAKILNNEGQEIHDVVKLSSNELYSFQVKVTVPLGTSVEHWNSLQLSASSEACVGQPASLILNTFIPNPNQK